MWQEGVRPETRRSFQAVGGEADGRGVPCRSGVVPSAFSSMLSALSRYDLETRGTHLYNDIDVVRDYLEVWAVCPFTVGEIKATRRHTHDMHRISKSGSQKLRGSYLKSSYSATSSSPCSSVSQVKPCGSVSQVAMWFGISSQATRQKLSVIIECDLYVI